MGSQGCDALTGLSQSGRRGDAHQQQVGRPGKQHQGTRGKLSGRTRVEEAPNCPCVWMVTRVLSPWGHHSALPFQFREKQGVSLLAAIGPVIYPRVSQTPTDKSPPALPPEDRSYLCSRKNNKLFSSIINPQAAQSSSSQDTDGRELRIQFCTLVFSLIEGARDGIRPW